MFMLPPSDAPKITDRSDPAHPSPRGRRPFAAPASAGSRARQDRTSPCLACRRGSGGRTKPDARSRAPAPASPRRARRATPSRARRRDRQDSRRPPGRRCWRPTSWHSALQASTLRCGKSIQSAQRQPCTTGQQQSLAQPSPRQLARPSRTATAAITSAAKGSAHHQPTSALAPRPIRSASER